MILVPNHQQLLNGSKLLCLLFIGSMVFSSCDMFKKVQKEEPKNTQTGEELEEIQGTLRYNPKTGKYEQVTKVTQKIDTVKWTVTDPVKDPPITTSGGVYGQNGNGNTNPQGNGQSEFRDAYNVAIMLPFLANRFDQITGKADPKSELALNFYYGAKMAFDVLSKEGVNLNISTFDTKASDGEVSSLLNRPELTGADIIMGPVRKSSLEKTANFAKQNGITLVSPFSPSAAITKNNPYYLQVMPSLESHCYAITKHVLARHSSSKVVLVARNKAAEVNRLKYFQDANYTIGGRGSRSFGEFVVTDNSADFSEMDVTSHIIEGDTTIFIVPSWSNESFVYSFLRQLKVAKGKNPVIVYGMPQWMKYKRVSYDYYEELNLHVSSAFYVDATTGAARDFRRNFYNRYGMVPSEEAYAGYDVMLLLGRSAKKYGTMFQKKLDRENRKSLVTRFQFEPVVTKAGIAEEDYTKIDRYENKYVNILRFKDYYFQLSK